MTDETVFLPLFMDEEIYVFPENTTEEQTPEEDPAPFFSGNKDATCAILLFHQKKDHISEKEKVVLKNIMQAVSQPITDTILINTWLNPEQDIKKLISYFSFKKILGFGLNPSFIQSYSPNMLHNIHGIQAYFCSNSLSDLSMNKQQKLVLWNALQKMFLIS